MDHAVIDGVRLGYELTGEGEPVVLIGGTGMPQVGWEFCGLPQALREAGFRVVHSCRREP